MTEPKRELLPCPFCGCKEIIAEINTLSKRFVIYRGECPATIELGFTDANIGDGSFISFYEAINIMGSLTESWNRRANDEQC